VGRANTAQGTSRLVGSVPPRRAGERSTAPATPCTRKSRLLTFGKADEMSFAGLKSFAIACQDPAQLGHRKSGAMLLHQPRDAQDAAAAALPAHDL
jgi:hypothetical protein